MISNQFQKQSFSLTRTVKVRPPTRSLASKTTGVSPLAFNSLAALRPANLRKDRDKLRTDLTQFLHCTYRPIMIVTRGYTSEYWNAIRKGEIFTVADVTLLFLFLEESDFTKLNMLDSIVQWQHWTMLDCSVLSLPPVLHAALSAVR